MRKSNQLSSQLGELQDAIQMAIFKYLRSHETLGDELFNIGGEQVTIYHGELPSGLKGILVHGRNTGRYEGTHALLNIDLNHQLDILEQIEDILRID